MKTSNIVKIGLTCGIIGGVAFFTGCATSPQSPVVLSVVGPETSYGPQNNSDGTLLVFSEIEIFNENSSDVLNVYSQYSDYEIWTEDGSKCLQRVHNHIFPFSDDNPVKIRLTPGRYLVKSPSARFGWVHVPVVVVAHQVTTVHLDARYGAVKTTKESPDTVYLPDGEIVGTKG